MAAAEQDDELALAIAMSLEPAEADVENKQNSTRHPGSLPQQPAGSKRHWSSADFDDAVVLSPAGEARRIRLRPVLVDHQQLDALVVSHGSSLSLISRAVSGLTSLSANLPYAVGASCCVNG